MNHIDFARYDVSTGRILAVGRVPAEFLDLQDPPFVLGKADIDMDYVHGGAITRRPKLKLQFSGGVLKGVPAGAVITVDGEKYHADGSDLEMNFSAPGVYKIHVSLWPYLDAEFTHAYQP